jgi:hypothetical protein
MSFIKKALKDAETARPKAAPFTGPQMMAVDFPPRAGHSNVALTALIAVTMLLSGIMMWKWFRADNGDMKVRARSYDSVVNPVAAPQPPAIQPAPSPAPAVAPPRDTKTNVEPVKTVVVERPSADPATNAPVVIQPKPRTFSYKLQGIVYEPGHCSAIINGKTVVAGERVDGALVIKVGKDTVTLVNPRGETNLLEVP